MHLADFRRYATFAILFAIAPLLLGGCLEKRIQWSPDGNQAALITADGLFLTDAEGQLSPLLLPDVNAVAWLSDSRRLAVAATGDSNKASLVIARLEGERLIVAPPLYTGPPVVDIRVSPDDRFLAFTAEGAEVVDYSLLVAPCDASTAADTVSQLSSAYPDWSADGTSLVYFEGSRPSDGSDELMLGTLVRRRVVAESGQLELAEEPGYLAGVLFSALSRVRCLRDGRIVFSAQEVSLPFATADVPHRELLFAVDPHQPTLVRLVPRQRERELPRQLSYFEISPDESQVLFGTDSGGVYLLTLQTGDVRVIQPGTSAENNKRNGTPVWRRDGEFTYVKRLIAVDDKSSRRAEVVLVSGEEETLLSAGWSDRFIAQLVKSK